MPTSPTYPGVYIEEIPSGVRTITGVATSITAFIGRTTKGPVNKAVRITSYGDFERIFGGLAVSCPVSYAVRDFYRNGGSDAVIVRLFNHLPIEGQLPAAQEAGKAVATKATGGDVDAVIAAVETEIKKDAYKNEPQKSAAEYVAAVVKAVKAFGADKDAVIAAAKKSTSFGKVELTIGNIKIESASPGSWGNALRATIDRLVSPDVAARFKLDVKDLFNLIVTDTQTGQTEKFINLSLKESPRRVDRVLKAESQLVRWAGIYPDLNKLPQLPTETTSDHLAALSKAVKEKEQALDALSKKKDPVATPAEKRAAEEALDGARKALGPALTGEDSLPLSSKDYSGSRDAKTGIFALEDTDLFNLLCIPADVREGETDKAVYADVLPYCIERRAFLIVDPPQSWKAREALLSDPGRKLADDLGLSGDMARNAAVFYPRVMQSDLLRDGQIQSFVPCGVIAGVMARTDAQRGVWKAPAGIDAVLNGVHAMEIDLTDKENGILNPIGINCLRTFPIFGRVTWGTRTLRGADQAADEYKYIPVRRTALFIEESLYRGTKWVVFEPNDEPLWAQIRLNIGAFMHNLFRQGAFQGTTPREAYFVKCDKETTTQNDINLGIVNIVVGFAPLKPAEFVIIKLQQMAGQIEV